jgi:hypothetical protein
MAYIYETLIYIYIYIFGNVHGFTTRNSPLRSDTISVDANCPKKVTISVDNVVPNNLAGIFAFRG